MNEADWRRKMAQLDYDTMMKGARNEGFSNGYSSGYSSGAENARLADAKAFKAAGFDPAVIANAIGLPLDVVNSL